MELALPRTRVSCLLALLLAAVVLVGVMQHSSRVGFEPATVVRPSPTELRASQLGQNVQFTTKDLEQNVSEQAFLKRMEKGNLSQDDPELANLIRKYYLVPPSDEAYNMRTEKDTSMGQAAVINKILKNQTNGFFVECGALDGETRSNTYFFERQLGWTGLLIEGDPNNFGLILPKHRKAYSINACLSITDKPTKVTFNQNFNLGKIDNSFVNDSGHIPVQCFPLQSMLAAMSVTRVDYFSLDVEGAELDVLRAIPFDKLDIRTLSVEYIHDTEGEDGVRTFMEGKNYVAHSKVNHPGRLANDIIFVKKEL